MLNVLMQAMRLSIVRQLPIAYGPLTIAPIPAAAISSKDALDGDSAGKRAISSTPHEGGPTMSTFLLIFAVVNLANGVWMLVDPAGWFTGIPAAVPDTGPFNPHFVRDVGVAYCVTGIGLAWCARNLERALPVLVGIILFNAGHAITHVADIIEGRLPPSHWLIDTPGLFAPTAALIAAGVILARRAPARL